MIKKIEIDNLKSIKHMQMECSDINLLIGTNSSGKSSVIQGLLFVIQNMEQPCGLNGALISLGTFEENRCVYANDKIIKVVVDDGKYIASVSLKQNETGDTFLSRFSKQEEEWDILTEKWSYKKRNFQFLSCHRVGPLNVYNKNMTMDDVIDINGEFAIAFLNKHAADILEPGLCKGDIDYTLQGQVNWWLSYIADAEINTEEISGADLVKASYKMYDVIKIRPVNIGSGISYLISILIICLSSPENAMIAMENPEIHLHPMAQAKLCEFFYFISQNNRQLFVESHSDHVFNGFRAGIATGEMEKEKINIQFISLDEENVSQALKVQIGRMGRIENQKKYMFDQFDLDLNKMIGLRGDK